MVELKTRKTRSTGNAGKSLQHAFTTGPMAENLMKRMGWDPDIFNTINWEARAMVVRGMTHTDKIQMFKLSHGALPFMYQQNMFGYSNTSISPVCKEEEETIPYMLWCQILTNPE